MTPTPTAVANARRWHGVRRWCALGALGLWFLLGCLPLRLLIAWAMAGDPVRTNPGTFFLVGLLPALLHTASAAFALAILCSRHPAQSRLAWYQVSLFASAVARKSVSVGGAGWHKAAVENTLEFTDLLRLMQERSIAFQAAV